MRRFWLACSLLGLAAVVSAAAGCTPPRQRWSSADLYGKPRVPAMAYEAYVRGRKASYEGRHGEATAYFRQAAALTPGDPSLRVAIADELIADGQLDDAAAEAKSILGRWPEEPDGWVVAGRVAARRGDDKAAVLAYEQAIALEPEDEWPYLLAAGAHVRLGDDPAAVATFERLLGRWPDSVEGHYRLGFALSRAHEYEKAERHLVRATSLDPDHVDARVALATVYRRTSRAKLATETLRDAFDRSGEDSSVGEQLFRALLENGDRDAALELLGVLDADWRDPDARLLFGYLYLAVHHAPEALAIADALIARADTNHAARILRARALVQARRRADAITTCLEIPASASEYPEARALAADLYAKDGKIKEGRALLAEALAVYPDSVPLLVTQATLLERGGDVPAAREALAAAQAKHVDDQDLVYARAALEDRNGAQDQAVAIMQELLDAEPDNVMALNFIGYSLAARGVELTRATELLERAVALRPDDGYVLDSYGWLLYQQQRLDQAVDVLEHADRLAPDEPEILYHLGEVYARRGDRVRAREMFNRALTLDPEDKIRLRLEERVKTADAQTK